MKSRLALLVRTPRRGRVRRRRAGCREQHRRPRSARLPPITRPRRRRSPSGAPRPGVRSSRPAPAGSSARRTSATSSRARRPCTWASSTSPSTTPRWRSRAATGRMRPRRPRRADTSAAAAIATAAYETLTGLQPQLGVEPDDPRRRLRRLHGRDPGRRRRRRTGSRSASRSPQAVLALRVERRPRVQHPTLADLGPPAPGPGVWQPRARAGARPSPTRDAAARPAERLAVPARRPQRPDEPGVRRRPQPGQGPGPHRQRGQDARARRSRRCSGPTTTSGSGTTACSASPPPAGSTSCRRPGCWRWRTSPAATR